MKKYKTWEVFKMLSEKSLSTFERISDGLRIGIDLNNLNYTWKMGVKHLSLNDEWILVPQPVSFMEAVKALNIGKKIYCKLNGKIYRYEGEAIWTSTVEILKGTWYIGEPEE